MICSLKTVPFRLRFPRYFPWLGGAEDDDGITVFGCARGVHSSAGSWTGIPVADICRKAGISQATYFNWKKKYDGMQPLKCGG